MKMLAQEEETDTEVTWEDQQNINTFSRLNMKLQNLEDVYEEKKREKEYLDDLSTELELADEDELVPSRIGDAFISLPLESCKERIESEQEALSAELEQVSSKMSDITEQMNKLKVVLYKRFGNSINLER